VPLKIDGLWSLGIHSQEGIVRQVNAAAIRLDQKAAPQKLS
jgi:hypothetical protein